MKNSMRSGLVLLAAGLSIFLLMSCSQSGSTATPSHSMTPGMDMSTPAKP